jgi:hypothetical protein
MQRTEYVKYELKEKKCFNFKNILILQNQL